MDVAPAPVAEEVNVVKENPPAGRQGCRMASSGRSELNGMPQCSSAHRVVQQVWRRGGASDGSISPWLPPGVRRQATAAVPSSAVQARRPSRHQPRSPCQQPGRKLRRRRGSSLHPRAPPKRRGPSLQQPLRQAAREWRRAARAASASRRRTSTRRALEKGWAPAAMWAARFSLPPSRWPLVTLTHGRMLPTLAAPAPSAAGARA